MVRQKVLGVLAGTDIPDDTIAAWAKSADIVVAADGAANRLIAAGITRITVVGDLDSLDPAIERKNLAIEEDADQETTDCDKLLVHIQSRYKHPQFSLIGLEGDRFDHVISSLQSAARLYPACRLVLRDGFAWFVQPGRPVRVDAAEGQIVSLVPLIPCAGVVMEGVKWPPKPNLSPLGATSISNVATASSVSAALEHGLALFVQQTQTTLPNWD